MSAWHATMFPSPGPREGTLRMFRKDLITLLLDNPLRLSEIARLYDVPLKEVLDDVKHLRKTLKQSTYRLDVTAAECRKCSFVFSTEKLSKPSKCPQCRSTWLEEPVVQIIEA
jgi:predicted Zn-ribbon and HTH transcriptional regulator